MLYSLKHSVSVAEKKVVLSDEVYVTSGEGRREIETWDVDEGGVMVVEVKCCPELKKS